MVCAPDAQNIAIHLNAQVLLVEARRIHQALELVL